MTTGDGDWQLAVACARHAAGCGAVSDVVATAMSVTDWPRALGVARDQGLGALLAKALVEGDAPEVIRDRARDAVATSTARTLGQQRLLARVLAALRDAG